MSKRSIRRHHIERLRKVRKGYYGRELDEKELGKTVNTPKRTQHCRCCTNPRRWNGEKTVQEKRIEQAY